MKNESGIYKEVSWEDYLEIPRMSPSTAKTGLKSMLHLKRTIDGKCQPESKAIDIGNACHALVSNEYTERFCTCPAFHLDEANVTSAKIPKHTTSKNTNYVKERMSFWLLDNQDLEQIDEVEANIARKLYKQIRDRWGELIDKSDQEVVVLGDIGLNKTVPWKTRLDGLCIEELTVWDIKTTLDISDSAFYRVFERLGYGFSAAVHVHLLEKLHIPIEHYKILACESSNDYDVREITVPMQLIENYLPKVEEISEKYRIAVIDDHWPGLPDAPLFVPDWQMAQWDREEELTVHGHPIR
jgi:hypothetical protein